MFIETVTAPREEHDEVLRASRLLDEPPPGLAASVSWEAADGMVTQLMVWDSPAARGEFAEKVMMPLFASGQLANVTSDPTHHKPVRVWIR